MVCPTLATAISLISSAAHKPSIKAIKALKQMMRYTQGKRSDGLHYIRTREYGAHEFPQMEYSCDSSFHDHVDLGKSTGGAVGRIAGMAAMYFRSGRSAHITTCSAHAEKYQAAEAGKQIVYERQMCHELGFNMPKYILYMGNAAVIKSSTGKLRPFSQQVKHYLLSERFLTQCVEAGFVEVVYKNTHDLDADAMTKALPGPTLAQHARTLEYCTAA